MVQLADDEGSRAKRMVMLVAVVWQIQGNSETLLCPGSQETEVPALVAVLR